MSEELTGLSSKQVTNKKALGLQNSVIDTYSPGYTQIFLRNVFSVINIVVFPLLIFLAYFQLYMEVLAFGFFILINTLTSLFDEIRIKREIDKLKKQFLIKATVLRDDKKIEIPLDQIVEDDICFAKEGDQIVAEGEILRSSYLQLDESVLTGESDYIQKDKGDKVYSSTFVVTGECYYRVTTVGTENYTNKLAQATTKYQKVKSPLQRNADKLISILIFISIALGVINFFVTSGLGEGQIQARILSVTAITALIIPQTLIFLFTLTFSISITRLFSKGVLVQRGASIENLANTNVICFDKTGTITTNKMSLSDTISYDLDEFEVGRFYSSCADRLFGVSKTQSILCERYCDHKKLKIQDFDQKPFTSKDKYSYFTALYKGDYHMFVLGAYEKLLKVIPNNPELEDKIKDLEKKGKRLLIGMHLKSNTPLPDPFNKLNNSSYQGSILYIFDEELNLGIVEIINKLNEQGIAVKIISGDSYGSVKTTASKIGIDTTRIVDLSTNKLALEDIAEEYQIFTRATPDDKLKIITALKEKENTVAMIGDGVNDVLSMKAADVSIAMENGASVTRSTADMVLLKNDYSKIPDIFHEGENIIFNLKLSTKLFLAKSLFAIVTALVFTILEKTFPIHPSSTLIFSFYGASLPSYILIFSRQTINKQSKRFFASVFSSAIPAALIMSIVTFVISYIMTQWSVSFRSLNTIQAMQLLSGSLIYALFVIYRSGKVKNLKILISFFAIGMYLGLIQTLLPLDLNAGIASFIFTLTLILIGALAIFIIGFKRFVKGSFNKFILLIIACLAWILLLSFFPFRDYYNVAMLSDEQFVLLIITTIVYVIFFTLEYSLWKVLFNKI
jgi:cation-transporting ATPase E